MIHYLFQACSNCASKDNVFVTLYGTELVFIMKKLLFPLTFLCISTVSFAQDFGLTVSKLDSLPELIQYYLTESTSKHFEDPKVPRFLLKDRTDNFVFGVGGGVEAKMYYDMQGDRGNSFSMSKGDSESKYDNDVVDFTLYSTNIVMKVLGKTNAGVVDALVSIDFGNTGGGVRLMQAYVDVFGLRIGKANSAFSDDESINLVDGFSLLSTTGRKLPQVSYSYRFNNGIRAQAGIEFPQSASIWLVGAKDRKITPFNILLPDLTANVYYSGERIHLYGGVNSRLMNYYDDKTNARRFPSYAVQLSMNWSFLKTAEQTHKLFAQGIWSHGMADCCTSMRNQGLSAIVDTSIGDYFVPNILGGSMGYQFVFGNNTIDIAGSINSASGHRGANVGEMYNWAYSGVVNYFRKFMTYGTAGVEAMVGRKYDLNANSYTNVRAYLFLRYNF